MKVEHELANVVAGEPAEDAADERLPGDRHGRLRSDVESGCSRVPSPAVSTSAARKVTSYDSSNSMSVTGRP